MQPEVKNGQNAPPHYTDSTAEVPTEIVAIKAKLSNKGNGEAKCLVDIDSQHPGAVRR